MAGLMVIQAGVGRMLSITGRIRLQQSRTGRYLLISGLMHLLAAIVLNRLLIPSDTFRLPQKSQPMRVSFIRPVTSEEPVKAEAFAEASSRAQMPDGSKADGGDTTEAILPVERPIPSQPPQAPRVQVRGQPQALAQHPHTAVTPSPASQTTPKRATTSSRHEAKPKQPLRTADMSQRPLQERPQLQRFAKLPEPTKQMPHPSLQPHPRPQDDLPGENAPETDLPQGWLLGRIPLLSGDDLDKYANVRSSDQPKPGGNAISLNTKEIKYISYFAHIKRKIEGVWSYPPDAIANGIHGQLQLKFVLQRSGEVKIIELLRSSGYKILDKEAWDAVITAGPFDPFPPLLEEDELYITARFTYESDTTLRRTMVR